MGRGTPLYSAGLTVTVMQAPLAGRVVVVGRHSYTTDLKGQIAALDSDVATLKRLGWSMVLPPAPPPVVKHGTTCDVATVRCDATALRMSGD